MPLLSPSIPSKAQWTRLLRGCARSGCVMTLLATSAVAEPAPDPTPAVHGTEMASASPVASPVAPPVASPVASPGPSLGKIHGIVADPGGDLVPGATITIERPDSAEIQSTEAASDGSFAFGSVPSGPYRLAVTASGFKPWIALGSLAPGEDLAMAKIALPLSAVSTEIEVSASRKDVAAAQLGLQEQQRVLGVFPNFYASYIWNADPLSAAQKFSLAWRFSVDPVSFGMAGFIAGTEQAQNSFSGYHQGTLGYAKRFGAIYTDGFSSTMLGGAIFPALFHQDPRYFVKGTGSVSSRALYAMATAVICKGDNGHWQANYSNLLGNVASAGISNLYYPASDRHGARLTLQNSMLTTALGAAGGLIQEFMLHRMTPHIPDYNAVAQQ